MDPIRESDHRQSCAHRRHQPAPRLTCVLHTTHPTITIVKNDNHHRQSIHGRDRHPIRLRGNSGNRGRRHLRCGRGLRVSPSTTRSSSIRRSIRVGCSNELNAAYAADGYARMRRIGAVCTTFGVGELAAMSGIAGSYAEHLAVFHLVGAPNLATQEARALVHHTLGNGEFDLFHKMAEPIVCASAIITPQNVASETERLIDAALYHRRPVYMAIPGDVAAMPVLANGPAPSCADQRSRGAGCGHRRGERGTGQRRPGMCAARVLVRRLGLQDAVAAFVDAAGLPFATMFGDKSVLGENRRTTSACTSAG
ncbi:thiamine pyrophosphate-binding protein [Prescottella defluvii]|nr:thiamine pyrophosphate-binding protein [Prescottella defluvii]